MREDGGLEGQDGEALLGYSLRHGLMLYRMQKGFRTI
jgi:hypothetical protein